jgi:hypothetical protein
MFMMQELEKRDVVFSSQKLEKQQILQRIKRKLSTLSTFDSKLSVIKARDQLRAESSNYQ